MLRVWRTHHPYADFFFFWLTRFLIAHTTNTKTQMKKNEPSGLLFTSSLLAKSGLEVTPLCREATRCKHRYRARAAESLRVVHQSGAASRSCAVRAQKKWRRHDEHSGRTSKELEEGTRRWEKVLIAVFDELFVENLGSSVGKCVLAARDRC